MTQVAFESLPALARTLETFCREGRSGVLHIVTSDNHTALFGLIEGNIVATRYRIRKDARALEQILGVSSGRYRFEETSEVEPGSMLPPTDEILAMLGTGQSNPAQHPTQSNSVPAQQAALEPEQQLASSTQTTLLEVLSGYAGPVASLLARSVFANTSNPSEAITRLAEKLPDPSRARAFADEARAKLDLR